MNIALIIVILYMVSIILIASFSTKLLKNKDSSSYLLAGQSMPWWLVAVMVTGLAVGGASTVGVAAQAYSAGLSAGWYTIAWSCASIIFGLVISGKVREYNIVTISGLITDVFGKNNGRISIIMQVILMFGINALQIVAGGAILTALLPDYFNATNGMIFSTVIYILTSFIGGYLGASISNLINVIVIYLGLIAAVISSINHFGGMEKINMALPVGDQWYSMFSGVGPALIIGWIITMVMTSPPNQMLFQAAAAAKDEKHAKNGFLVAALLIGPTGILAAFIGVIAASQFPGLENPSMALPMLVMSLPPFLSGIVLSGLWAADVSTAIGLLLGISTIVTKDVALKIDPDMSEKRQVLVSKLVLVGVALMGLFVALRISSILGFLMNLMTLYSPYCLLVICIFYAPKLLKHSTCFATVLVGIITMVVWVAIPATHIVSSVIYLSAPVCAATIGLCYIFDKRVVDISIIDKSNQ